MSIVRLIIGGRLPLTVAIGLITVFMSYQAFKAEISHDFTSTVPTDDPAAENLAAFREQFGEDGNVMAVAMKDSSVFLLSNFKKLRTLCNSIEALQGVSGEVSLSQMKKMEKDVANTRFVLTEVFPDELKSQKELDSLLKKAREQKFYASQIINEENGAIAILIFLEQEVLNSSRRLDLTRNIVEEGEAFSRSTGITLHYVGLPFMRSVVTNQVTREMKFFLPFSMVIAGLALLFFFRSFRIMIFAMIILGVAVIWSVGTIALLGFKITLFSAMIPPIITVIGIPNTIYFINKYHSEYIAHGNKMMAISRMIQKVGIATLLTNFTTAIGFLVLLTTDIAELRQFGIVAGLNVMATFLVSIILIPGIFSWIAPPSPRELRHLKVKVFNRIVWYTNWFVHHRRMMVYVISFFITGIALFGVSKLHTVSHISDDLPEQSTVLKDLHFVEQHFGGVMPMEVVVNTGRKKGVLNLKNMKKIEEFESFLKEHKQISQPLSLIGFIKAVRQAFYNNNPDRYGLPTNREIAFILPYMKNQLNSAGLFNSFADSTMQTMRISLRVADMGSDKLDSLLNQIILPKMKDIFAKSSITATVTGTMPVFVRGNDFLIQSLKGSLFLAFGLIAIIMGFLFGNFRMFIVSLIPNLVPMLITAALMGYFGIPLKPSTILIFSIIFGISVDYSIHFLAKYRQELYAQNFFVLGAVTSSILEVGKSMVYTSIVLFSGFIIFAFSSFGGTVALGILTSTTLVMSVIANLTLLPSLIVVFNHEKYSKRKKHAPIDDFTTNLDLSEKK